jgi:hypothetical protein
MTPDAKLVTNKLFNSFRTFPYTCYNIHNKKDVIFNFLHNLNLSKDDIVFFSYGETDIRCHIGFNSNNPTEETQLIDCIVSNYIELLLEARDKFGFKIGCWGVIASGVHNGPNGNDQIPSYSNCIERNKITIQFNNALQLSCNKHDIAYKDIFNHLVNSNMVTKHELYCDIIHLGVQCKPLLLSAFSDVIRDYTS